MIMFIFVNILFKLVYFNKWCLVVELNNVSNKILVNNTI